VTDAVQNGAGIDVAVYKSLAQGLDCAVAIVRVDDWGIEFENGRFFRWFEPSPDEPDTLGVRMRDFKPERATSRLTGGRTLTFETKVSVDDQETPLRVSVAPFYGHEDEFALVQVHSIAKEMEIQYMLDSYSRMAEKNAHELEKEKERVERLLLNIMPKAVVDEMKEYGTATPQRFESVSILMLDFVGFTDMTISQDPSAIISELNDIFSAFDRIADMFDCERVKTIGDAYIAVSGLPEQTPEHAHNIARLALRFRRYLERRNQAHPQEWIARIGINTGPVIGSLVGVQKYVYDLFGPGINFASRMETASEPMHITLNEDTMSLLKDDFVFTDIGEREIKGFGTQHLYALDGELAGRRF
jgi:class 3 adenylate cyclase